MKNLIIILSIILLGSCAVRRKQESDTNNAKSNQTMRYKSLEKFNGDTLAFVQQSILGRKEYYIGKELGVLLKDFGIPIERYSYSPAPINVYKVYDTGLWIRDYRETKNKLAKNEDPISLVIRWDPPLDANALDSLPKGKYTGEWTHEVEKYLSKQIVGDIVKTDYKLKE